MSDTPETDATSCSNEVEMLTAQSDPSAFYHRLCDAVAEIGKWKNDFDVMKRQRDEARQKYDTEATEHMLAVNKLCNERDEAREDARLLAYRLTELELQTTEELARLEQELNKLKEQ